MPHHPPAIVEKILIPLLAACITGLFAGLLAAAIGWPGVAVGAGAALLAWILRPGNMPDMPTMPAQHHQAAVKVTVTSEDKRTGEYIELPASPEKLRTLAAGLLAGQALTTREWTGSGALFSQAEFARLRGALIVRGLARWTGRDPRNGCILTGKGRAVMRGLAPHQPEALATSTTTTSKHAHTSTQED